MTSKERMLRALARQTPDRVPATVHQWQGFHLRTYLDGITDLQAFQRFGLDASLSRMPCIPQETPDWQVTTQELDAPVGERRFSQTVTTPGGSLTKLLGSNAITCWEIEPLVKRHEDVELIERYMPVLVLDKPALQREYDALGDDGIMRGFVFGDQGGCWQHACCLVGTQELILEAADNPDWVHHLLEILWQKKARYIEESMRGAAYDLIETGGGAASSTVISPRYYREFCLPYDRKMHDMLHAQGHRVVYHTCGGMMPILELIVQNGCDAAETLTPPAMGGDARAAELKQRIGDQVALIGGMDQNTYLENGTPQSTAQHVRDLFATYGANGGYIMSPSDHFFHASAQSLQCYAQTARDCAY